MVRDFLHMENEHVGLQMLSTDKQQEIIQLFDLGFQQIHRYMSKRVWFSRKLRLDISFNSEKFTIRFQAVFSGK